MYFLLVSSSLIIAALKKNLQYTICLHFWLCTNVSLLFSKLYS